MRKNVRIAALAVFAFGTYLGYALAAAPPSEPFQVTNFGKKGPVTFDHSKHSDSLCADCHHKEAEGKFKCGECHKAEPAGEAVNIKDAMHKKESGKCRSCHFGTEATAKKLKCADCHKK